MSREVENVKEVFFTYSCSGPHISAQERENPNFEVMIVATQIFPYLVEGYIAFCCQTQK
jgi:hypothetical protein